MKTLLVPPHPVSPQLDVSLKPRHMQSKLLYADKNERRSLDVQNKTSTSQLRMNHITFKWPIDVTVIQDYRNICRLHTKEGKVDMSFNWVATSLVFVNELKIAIKRQTNMTEAYVEI